VCLLLVTAVGRAMRLRVKCSSAYLLGDLQWCMVHVPEHIRTIRDFAGHVSRLLELNVRGGNGTEPQVSMGGFLIPYGEEVRIVLRDDEIVDVAPMDEGCSALLLASQTPQLTGKRDSNDVHGADAGTNGRAQDKRARRGGAGTNGDAAVAAIGWQPPEESASTKMPVVAEAACAGGNQIPAKKVEAASSSVASKNAKTGAPKPRISRVSSEESDEDDSSEEEPPPNRSKRSGASGNLARDFKVTDGDADGSASKKVEVASTSMPAKAAKTGAPKPRISRVSSDESDDDDSDEDPPPKKKKGLSTKEAQATSDNSTCAQQAAAAQIAALATCSNEPTAALEVGGSGDSGNGDCGLFVGGLPYQLEEADFRKYFEFYGAVVDAKIVMNNRTGKPKGFGFIEFAEAESRTKALADGPNPQIAGKQVEIKPRQGKGGKGEGKSGKDGGKFGSKGGKGGKDSGKGGKDSGKSGKGGKDGKDSKGGGKAGAGGKGTRTADGSSRGHEQQHATPALPSTVGTGTNNVDKQNGIPATLANEDIGEEEAEVQRQMAALGLPVCFTANQATAGESDDDEDDGVSEEDSDSD